MTVRRIGLPRAGEPGMTLWAVLVGIAIGFLLSVVVFGARAERLERELAMLHDADPTQSGD
jgi:hypothetical protein